MAQTYRYHRQSMRLEFYTQAERQSSPPPPGEQPPFERDLFPVHPEDTLELAEGEPDIRKYPINTPNGDQLGMVESFLADAQQGVVPYAYVRTEGGRLVTVPTNQLSIYPENCLVVLDGGKAVLENAPEATFEADDAENADRYWINYRRRNAA